MKRLLALLILLLAAVAPAAAPVAQTPGGGCTTIFFHTAALRGTSLEVYGLDRRYAGEIDKQKLPAEITLRDCNDPKFLMLRVNGEMMLVPKLALANIPDVSAACYCVPPGQAPGAYRLGAPGISDPPVCTPEQCARR